METISSFQTLEKYLLTKTHTWLITGVAGFIGSNLLETLLRLNQRVIGIDNFATGLKANLDDVLNSVSPNQQKNFDFHEMDICSLEACKKVIGGVEYVLHQAALGSVPRSIKLPEETHAANTTGFLNMLISTKDANVKRFVYASSSSVYGDSPELPKQEETIGHPLSPYAVSKYTNELYAKAFSNCYGIETIGLRYFNVFGPRQDPNGPYAAVIPQWFNALLNNQPIYINGDGKTTRDFCYVENAVQANLLAATNTNPGAVNEVYNVAVGEQNSLNTLLKMIMETLNITTHKHVVYRDFRPGDILHSLANIGKAKTLLAYMPSYKLEDGLKMMVDWYISKYRP